MSYEYTNSIRIYEFVHSYTIRTFVYQLQHGKDIHKSAREKDTEIFFEIGSALFSMRAEAWIYAGF